MHLNLNFFKINRALVCFFVLLGIASNASYAQVSAREKLENQKYYQSFIKDNINYMREYVDSSNIKLMLNSMEQINEKIETELGKIELPPDIENESGYEEMPATYPDTVDVTMSEDIETEEEDVTLGGDPEMPEEKIDDLFKMPEADEDSMSPLDKYLPGRKKDKINKTSFIINYGLNFLGEPEGAGNRPVAKTWKSWFWEYGIQNRVRLGASKKAYLTYGITYLRNRFSLDNPVQLANVRTTGIEENIPIFVNVENTKEDPKLRISYLTVPLSFRFKIAKKTYIDLGGFVGYNLVNSQTHVFKILNEKISEKRTGDYGVNDWTYGATAALKLFDTRFVFKYNLAPLFVENSNYNTNLLMIGFQSEI